MQHAQSMSGHLVSSLVPDWSQHVAEATPVSIEVDEDKVVVLDEAVNVGAVQLNSPAITETEVGEEQCEEKARGVHGCVNTITGSGGKIVSQSVSPVSEPERANGREPTLPT